MVLASHFDAAYLNTSKAHSRAGAHIILSENFPVNNINGPVLKIAKIIMFVISLAAEAEPEGLFICAKEMVTLHQTLMETG